MIARICASSGKRRAAFRATGWRELIDDPEMGWHNVRRTSMCHFGRTGPGTEFGQNYSLRECPVVAAFTVRPSEARFVTVGECFVVGHFHIPVLLSTLPVVSSGSLDVCRSPAECARRRRVDRYAREGRLDVRSQTTGTGDGASLPTYRGHRVHRVPVSTERV